MKNTTLLSDHQLVNILKMMFTDCAIVEAILEDYKFDELSLLLLEYLVSERYDSAIKQLFSNTNSLLKYRSILRQKLVKIDLIYTMWSVSKNQKTTQEIFLNEFKHNKLVTEDNLNDEFLKTFDLYYFLKLDFIIRMKTISFSFNFYYKKVYIKNLLNEYFRREGAKFIVS